MAILKLRGVTKDYLWGGVKLKEKFNQVSEKDIVAESWVISTHPDGSSYILNDEYKHQTLAQFVAENQASILGSKADKFEKFPILVKLIDAKQALSIQVHPDDKYALEHEQEYGKNEAWVVLEAEPDASIVYGTNHSMTKETFRKAIEEGTLMEDMREVKVKAGDVIYIPAGTIHAIGAGLVICEVQQSSNSTYRVFDFNRRDKNGQLRELHIEKAIDVSNLEPLNPDFTPHDEKVSFQGYCLQNLITTPYFSIQQAEVSEKMTFKSNADCFISFVIVEGEFTFCDNNTLFDGKKGDSFFIPAHSRDVVCNGSGKIIIATL